MSLELNKIRFARSAGSVRRLHTHRVLGEYDVAQHTFNALCMLRVLYPEARVEVYQALLSHDLPEFLTGDIPAPGKRQDWFDNERYAFAENKILRENWFLTLLSPEEEAWVNGIDCLEFMMFLADQEQLGNRTLRTPMANIRQYILEKIATYPEPVCQLFYELDSELTLRSWT